MLIFRFMLIVWVTARIGLYSLTLTNTSVFTYCPVQQLWIPQTLVIAPASVGSPRPPDNQVCSDWSAHTCLTHTANRATEQLCYISSHVPY